MLILISENPIKSDDLLKSAVKEYLRLERLPEFEPKIIREIDGKPILRPDSVPCSPLPAPRLSLSHSGRVTLAAVSDAPVGVDVEKIRPLDYINISKRFFGREIDGEKEFFDLWTLKEAYKKSSGVSLVQALKTDVKGKNLELFEDYSVGVSGEGAIFLLYIKGS
jgi:Phosphopantetheinyl transferase